MSAESKSMLQVYSDLGNPLEGVQKFEMIKYIDNLVLSGNYNLLDFEAIHKLGSVNGLIDWKNGIQLINHGATFDLNGAVFNGTTYIDSNFIPSINGINYKQDDAFFGGYINNFSNVTGRQYLFGVRDFFAQSDIRRENDFNSYNGRINALTGAYNWVTGILNNQLLIVDRSTNTDVIIYSNGVNVNSAFMNSIGLNGNSLWIARVNNVPLGFKGTISSFSLGGSIGFNQSQYNTDLQNLLNNI